jgi:chemosensory pili system protein ChpC
MNQTVTPSEIRGVLLPLDNGQLLLPNASVSEVVGYIAPDSVAGDMPAWLLGTVAWRQQAVPLVSFELLTGGQQAEIGHRARIAICNTLNGNTERPFMAILLRSIPHLVRVTEESVFPLEESGEIGEMVQRQVTINGQEAWIPDLDMLEKAVNEALG